MMAAKRECAAIACKLRIRCVGRARQSDNGTDQTDRGREHTVK